MKRQSTSSGVGRRRFLESIALAGAAATTPSAGAARVAQPQARVEYPSNRLANIRDLKVNEPLSVAYPDDDAPGVLVKLGRSAANGVGPDADIVGFSTICPHRGFPLSYSGDDRTFNCPAHFSRFDCEAGGLQICGHGAQNLPQYVLRIDAKGDIYAEGVDELLYGRLSNVL